MRVWHGYCSSQLSDLLDTLPVLVVKALARTFLIHALVSLVSNFGLNFSTRVLQGRKDLALGARFCKGNSILNHDVAFNGLSLIQIFIAGTWTGSMSNVYQ